jgi:hypothetical protein
LRPIEVIALSRRDTIDTACELILQATPGAQVWMSVPWRHPLALKLLNLKRLKRLGEDAGVDLRLISRHHGTRILAREAGLPVYSGGPLRLRRYRIARRQAAHDLRQRVRHYDGRLGILWEHRPRHLGFGAAFLSLLVLTTLLLTMVGISVVLVPGAQVVLDPVSERTTARARVTANTAYTDIDYGQSIIPGRMLEIVLEDVGDVPASGRVYIDDGHASGMVVFANRTNEPVTIPKGSIVRTTTGVNVRFYTLADVALPGRAFAHERVGIIALDSGPVGNVRSMTIKALEGNIASRVEVINDTPTTGGSVRPVEVVVAEDFDRLRAHMIITMQEQAMDALVGELGEGEFIPIETVDIRVMEQHFDQAVNQRSEIVSMRMRVVARGLVVDGEAMERLAEALLVQTAERSGSGAGGGASAYLGPGHLSQRELIRDSLHVEQVSEVSPDDSQLAEGIKKATFELRAEGMVTHKIDQERVKRALRGKSIEEASAWLMQELALRSEPHISMTPEWWERMPYLPARMNLVVSSGRT